tara:strand:- start:51333 stop:51551 length:219 start_codon:yes stop_codon:yes gene_type:complete
MEELIKNKIYAKLDDADIKVEGSDSKYTVYVNSREFEGKSIIDQHKIIYSILDEYIKSGEIHALTLKTAPKK